MHFYMLVIAVAFGFKANRQTSILGNSGLLQGPEEGPRRVGQNSIILPWFHWSEWHFVLRGTNVLWTIGPLLREKNLEKRGNIQNVILKVNYPKIILFSSSINKKNKENLHNSILRHSKVFVKCSSYYLISSVMKANGKSWITNIHRKRKRFHLPNPPI